MFEYDIVPIFENCGKIWELRLIMDQRTGANCGYAFATYTTSEETNRALEELNGYQIRSHMRLQLNKNTQKLRLYVGNIPKAKNDEELFNEFQKITNGLVKIITYRSEIRPGENRGFCFLEYETHNAATIAKRTLQSKRFKIFGCEVYIDWADPEEDPGDDIMSQIKILYVKNLTKYITEEVLIEEFSKFGTITRVKKIKSYAFVHFEERKCAENALANLNGKEFYWTSIEVTFAKPPPDRTNLQQMLRTRERRNQAITSLPPTQLMFNGQIQRNGGRFIYEGNRNGVSTSFQPFRSMFNASLQQNGRPFF